MPLIVSAAVVIELLLLHVAAHLVFTIQEQIQPIVPVNKIIIICKLKINFFIKKKKNAIHYAKPVKQLPLIVLLAKMDFMLMELLAAVAILLVKLVMGQTLLTA